MLVKFVTHTKVVLPIWSMYRSLRGHPDHVDCVFCLFFWPTGSKAGDQPVSTKQSREYDSMTDIAKCTETPSEGAVGRFTIYNRKIVELKIWQSYILPSLTTTPVHLFKYWGWNTAQCSWHNQRDLLRDNQSRVDSHDPTASSFHLSNADQESSTRKRAVEIFHSFLCSSNVFVPRFDAGPTRSKHKLF